MINGKRLKIKRGEDAEFVMKSKTRLGLDPLNLTGISNITVEMMKSNRQLLILSMSQLPARKAMTRIGESVIEAVTAGINGNSIYVVGNGTKTLKDIVREWNEQNPMNTIEVKMGGNIYPIGTYLLQGGSDPYFPIEVMGNPILGKFRVKIADWDTSSLRLGLDQSMTVKFDYGSHPSGTRIISQLQGKLDVIDPEPR